MSCVVMIEIQSWSVKSSPALRSKNSPVKGGQCINVLEVNAFLGINN